MAREQSRDSGHTATRLPPGPARIPDTMAVAPPLSSHVTHTLTFNSTYRPRESTPDTPISLYTLNPLADTGAAVDHPFLASAQPPVIAVLWSGWIGSPGNSTDGNVDPDFRAWSGTGRAQLDAFLARTLPRLTAAGTRLWLRPHARHILSDAPSCAAFLRDHAAACAAGTLALFLDLELLITPPMAPRRDEHADRILSRLLPMAGVAAVAMTRADWQGHAAGVLDALARERPPALATFLRN